MPIFIPISHCYYVLMHVYNSCAIYVDNKKKNGTFRSWSSDEGSSLVKESYKEVSHRAGPFPALLFKALKYHLDVK